MKKILSTSLLLTCIASSTLLAQELQPGFEHDFDHKVQFKLEKLDGKNYNLTVARLGNVNFSQMAVFAARKGLKVCGSMGYQLTYLDGVEDFDDRKAMPNYIFPPLKVKITCR